MLFFHRKVEVSLGNDIIPLEQTHEKQKCENSKGVIFLSRRGKLTDEERIRAVGEYLDGKGSYRAIAKKYGINRERFRQLVIQAQAEGIESIKISQGNDKNAHTPKISRFLYCAF